MSNYEIGSKKFEEYYRPQFKEILPSDEEFERFIKTLKDKLPVTFRVNPSLVNYQEMIKLFLDPDFVEKYWIHQDDKVTEVKEEDKILFYEGEPEFANYMFSNFSMHPIEAYGRKFMTSEHLF